MIAHVSRRALLAGGLAATIAGLARGRALAAPGPRYLIVNADDFGMSAGVNRGIVDSHAGGIVTSASLLVSAPGSEDAVKMSAEHPELGIGLHVDLGLMPPGVPVTDPEAVSEEVARQADLFRKLMGRRPTHIDSHHHAHLRLNVARAFLDAGERLGVPVRGLSPVLYLGAFYAQWPPGQSNLARVSCDAFIGLVGGLTARCSEIGCHPGYWDALVADGYAREREAEVRTLMDPRCRRAIEWAGVALVSYRDYFALGVAGTPAAATPGPEISAP